MTLATSPEQIAVCTSISSWADRLRTTELVRADLEKPSDRWRELFGQLGDFGVFATALPERCGGLGGSWADVAAMLQECGRRLVPGPIVATVAAAVALSASDDPRAPELLDEVIGGERPAVVPARLTAWDEVPEFDGRLDLGPVAGYDDDLVVLVCAAVPGRRGSFWIVPPGAGVREVMPQAVIDGTASVSRVSITGLVADDLIACPNGPMLVGALACGRTAYQSGVARWALDTAVAYAKVRTQFGAPIGSFQAVKHLCADMLCDTEQIESAAWDLAGSLDRFAAADHPEYLLDQLTMSRLTADVLTADLPVRVTQGCVQVLGGIGFTFEHDAHLYLRSAVAARAAVGAATRQRADLARCGFDGVRITFDVDLSTVEERRAEVRAAVAEVAATDPVGRRGKLARSGYLAPHWPPPYGLGASPALQLLIDSEFEAADVERPDLVIGAWAVPTILDHGTDAQRDRFVVPTLEGDIVWCQLFSEPEAGSDLASLRTRATRADGGWLLSGQKIWTSQAHNAQWGICLARTDPEAPKHKGITYFLVDMSTPGIVIRPLRELSGQANFNEVFLDDVFVPDDCVVGEVNAGWRLARTTLANERVAMGGSGLGKEMDALLRQLADSSRALDAGEMRRLGDLVADAHIGRVLDARSVARRVQGLDPGALSSVRKLIGVAHRQSVPAFGQDLLGAEGLVASDAGDLLLQNRCLSIAGGTTQILRTAAAERILGLPRG
ncbi:acyl-CoA dehydrogenase family protein [Gordonia sp. NPDC003425]